MVLLFIEKQDEYRKKLDNVNTRRANKSQQIEHNLTYEKRFNPNPLIKSDRYFLDKELRVFTNENENEKNKDKKGSKIRLRAQLDEDSKVFYQSNPKGQAKQIIYSPLHYQEYDWNHPDWPTLVNKMPIKITTIYLILGKLRQTCSSSSRMVGISFFLHRSINQKF